MNKKDLTRRKFVSTVSAGTLGAVAFSGITSFGCSAAAGKLAVLGGTPVRQNKSWPEWPYVDEEILNSLMDTGKSGVWCRIQAGSRVPELEKRFAELEGAAKCVVVGSGTQALHTSLEALGIGAGDEVITSPLTDPGTIAAILSARALPVLADLDSESFQNDPDDIERKITENTRVIMPVHIAGTPCNLERIMQIAEKHNLIVIEDSCQGHMAEYKGKKLGTIGKLGCFSFQSSKTINCGEGGAIIGDDEELMDMCYTVQNHGTNRQGRTVTIGPKYRMNDLEAAILLGQLSGVGERFALRNENANYLTSRLKDVPGIVPQKQYEGTGKVPWYLYMMRYNKEHFNNVDRSVFVKAATAEGISIGPYLSQGLHREPWVDHILNLEVYKRFFSPERLRQYRDQLVLPKTDKATGEELLMIWSSGPFLGTKEDMDDIADAIIKVYENRDQLVNV